MAEEEWYLITYGLSQNTMPSYLSKIIKEHPSIWLAKHDCEYCLIAWEKLTKEHVARIRVLKKEKERKRSAVAAATASRDAAQKSCTLM